MNEAVVLGVEETMRTVVAPEADPRVIVDVGVGDCGIAARLVDSDSLDTGRVEEL